MKNSNIKKIVHPNDIDWAEREASALYMRTMTGHGADLTIDCIASALRNAERRGWENAALVADEQATYWSSWSDCSGQRIGCDGLARLLRERSPK